MTRSYQDIQKEMEAISTTEESKGYAEHMVEVIRELEEVQRYLHNKTIETVSEYDNAQDLLNTLHAGASGYEREFEKSMQQFLDQFAVGEEKEPQAEQLAEQMKAAFEAQRQQCIQQLQDKLLEFEQRKAAAQKNQPSETALQGLQRWAMDRCEALEKSDDLKKHPNRQERLRALQKDISQATSIKAVKSLVSSFETWEKARGGSLWCQSFTRETQLYASFSEMGATGDPLVIAALLCKKAYDDAYRESRKDGESLLEAHKDGLYAVKQAYDRHLPSWASRELFEAQVHFNKLKGYGPETKHDNYYLELVEFFLKDKNLKAYREAHPAVERDMAETFAEVFPGSQSAAGSGEEVAQASEASVEAPAPTAELDPEEHKGAEPAAASQDQENIDAHRENTLMQLTQALSEQTAQLSTNLLSLDTLADLEQAREVQLNHLAELKAMSANEIKALRGDDSASAAAYREQLTGLRREIFALEANCHAQYDSKIQGLNAGGVVSFIDTQVTSGSFAHRIEQLHWRKKDLARELRAELAARQTDGETATATELVGELMQHMNRKMAAVLKSPQTSEKEKEHAKVWLAAVQRNPNASVQTITRQFFKDCKEQGLLTTKPKDKSIFDAIKLNRLSQVARGIDHPIPSANYQGAGAVVLHKQAYIDFVNLYNEHEEVKQADNPDYEPSYISVTFSGAKAVIRCQNDEQRADVDSKLHTYHEEVERIQVANDRMMPTEHGPTPSRPSAESGQASGG